jgi:hypothetical protein
LGVVSIVKKTDLGAEVLKRVSLNGVDAEYGVGLDSRETAGHCTYIASQSQSSRIHFRIILILVSHICPQSML